MAGRPAILLNALFLDPDVSGGPETYLRGLVPALHAARPEADLTVVTTRRGGSSLRSAGWPEQGIAVVALPCDEGQRLRRQIAEQVMLPDLASRRRVDLVHSLASIAPIRVRRAKHVITLHDVSFFHHATFGAITSWGMRQVVPRAARGADALITATAVARDEICATLGLAPSSFAIVGHGAEPIDGRAAAAPVTDVRARFGVGDDRLILCVAAKRPHKNQEVLIRALPHLPADVRLVLVGHAEPYESQLRALVVELGLSERVVFADWVDAVSLEGLWSVADVAAFPTLAEGFGLPLVEALARGVNVVASDIPVLREIGGSSPRYFDPRSPPAAAEAISAALVGPSDPEAGRIRALTFTWQAAAAGTWAVYDRVLSG